MSRDLITFRCPQCQAALSLPASLAGAAGPCLYCETEIIGPNPEIGQPARLASSAAPTNLGSPAARVAAAPTPPAPLEVLEPLQVSRPAATSAHPFPQQEYAPRQQEYAARQQESAPWDPFAPQAAPANPSPSQEPAAPSSPRETRHAQPTHDSPPFSVRDFAPPAPPAEPRKPAASFPTNRFSSESSTGAYPAASLPPLSRQTNPLSPEQQPYHHPQAQPIDPFRQQQPQARTTEPFAQQQPQTHPPFPGGPGGGYPASRDIPPPAAAPELPSWQEARRSNFPKIPKLPGGEALRDLIEQLRTSPLAPLAIAGTLVVLLIVFGIYLVRDYQEIVPDGATGGAPATSATSPAPTAVDAATATPAGTTAITPAVEPLATAPDATPNPIPAPTIPITPDPTPAAPTTATTPDPATGSVPDPITATSSTPPATTPDIDAPDSLLDGPIATLQAFVNAATWQERLNYSLYPEVVKPLMEIYYRNFPDEVVVPESIRFQHSETDPETEKRFFVFHVTTADAPDGFPVLIEETSDGLKVDWETFAEFKDNLFQRFSSNPSPGKLGAFHLIMRNAHYFGEEFPELQGLTPYRLDPPIPNQETYAFALTDSIVNKELQEQVTWGMNFTPFLELRWAKSQNGTDYLQVVSVLYTNWRNRTP